MKEKEFTLEGFRQAMAHLSEVLAPHLQTLNQTLELFARYSNFMDSVDAAGWLPYDSVSVQFVEECGGDASLLNRRLSEFYVEKWGCVQGEIESRLKVYAISEESKATFREALTAHREGLYRCVCRVVFPEIERVLRLHFFDGKAGWISSAKLIERFTGQGELEDFMPRRAHGWTLFGRLIEHVYEEVNEENREEYLSDSIPNRHAALHGLVAYSTYKHSVNMIILADYVFQVITDNYPYGRSLPDDLKREEEADA